MKLRNLLFARGEKELFKNNREAVDEFLDSVTHVASLILGILMAVMVVVSFKFGYTDAYKKVYLTFFVLDAALFLFTSFSAEFVKKRSLLFVYLFFTLYLCFSLIANYSAGHSQDYVSVIVVVFMIPFLLLDRSYRVVAFDALAVFAAAFLSFRFKEPGFFRSDIVNLVVYAFAGIVMGSNVRLNRLRGFETERVLTMERNTDPLTKLANRRKLFEYLRRGTESAFARPTGMFMIDIDKFKQYNDTFGHRAGDVCLGAIGNCFEDFGKDSQIKFFRYGGEEFCALCWSKNREGLAAAAEELLDAVRALQIPFEVKENPSGIVTISLGYAVFDRDVPVYDFEEMIKTADAALYQAKASGRNRACGAD